MENLKWTQKLSRKDLKNVTGGTKVPPPNCSCFCYIGTVKTSHSCFTYCPDGSIPGLNPGSGPDCHPPQLN